LRNIHVAGLSFDGRQTVDPRRLFWLPAASLATTPLSEHLPATLIPIKLFFTGQPRAGSNPATALCFEGCGINFHLKLPMEKSLQKLLGAAIGNYQCQHYAEAESLCRQLTSGPSPTNRACFLLGLVLGKTGRQTEAIPWLERAAQLDPAAPEVWSEIGRASNTLGDYARAADCFRRFIELRPENADGYFCLANAQQRLGQHEDAVALYRKSVELNAGDSPAWNNLGKALTELNRLPAALTAFGRALALEPGSALARRNRALALLKSGRWEEGWRDYEWRRSNLISRPYPQPKWNGEAIPQKTLLIYAEQGLGDSIQFVRFVPPARARVARVILECQPPLKRLFEHGGFADSVIAVGENPPPFDTQVALGSLPGISRATPENTSGRAYLPVPAGAGFSPPPGARRHVGLVWAGNATYERDAERSLPFEQIKPILQVADVTFFSFQAVVPARDEDCFRTCPQVVDLAKHLHDFYDTAALAAQMDLIISVDTAVAHLAGAMGKPVWLLLPFAPDWRWLLERADTPWYQTTRLFRQRQSGDWRTTVLQVADELSQFMARRK
jgi:tetratricopeptide (TPR) repeat protein